MAATLISAEYITILTLELYFNLDMKARKDTRSDNKVHKLVTVCLPWQQWTETSVWFDNVGISAFHGQKKRIGLWMSHSGEVRVRRT
jgi:hypothetical protein